MDIKNKAIIRFYNYFTSNEVESIDDIPVTMLLKIQAYNLKELCKPFAFDDAIKGASRDALAIKYRITVDQGRGIRNLAQG